MINDAGRPEGAIYKDLADRLRESIRAGEFEPGELIGSEYGLSRREKISRMTVRRASELLVNEGIIERRPGKGLYVTSAPTVLHVVQVVAGNLLWEPSLQVSRGVQQLGKEKGCQVQLYDAHGDLKLDLEVLAGLPEGPAEGAIILSLHSGAFNEAVYKLKCAGYPFVLVDQRLSDIEASSVVADNYSGGVQVGQHLLELGHRRIAFIGDLVAMTVRDRLAGLRDAVNDAGYAFDRNRVIDLDEEANRMADWSDRVEQCTQELFSRDDRPTAIFASCDAVARSVYRTLERMKLRIPQDVSVVGFDDDPLCEWLTPSMTTVRQPFVEMGRVAMDMLSKQIADPARPVEHRILPVTLTPRDSTAAVNAVNTLDKKSVNT